jgi:hypothetical protein
MDRVALAGLAVLLDLDPIRIVLLVLVGPVVAVLAIFAGERYRDSHQDPPPGF